MSNELEDFPVEEGMVKDNRTFTDRIFFNSDGKDLTPKKIVIVDCFEGDPEAFPTDRIMLMRSYKEGIERGRKDPLKKEDVIALTTDKGVYMIPLDEAEKFAACLYTIANSLKKKL